MPPRGSRSFANVTSLLALIVALGGTAYAAVTSDVAVAQAPTSGCPNDQDCDTTPDSGDSCPTASGPPSTGGCPLPDGDGDGTPDNNDACPTLSGSPSDGGCPPPTDTDGDGVLEPRDDKCPNDFNRTDDGCPDPRFSPEGDLDGDGLANAQDSCPVDRGTGGRSPGCPKFAWAGGAGNVAGDLGEVVDAGYIELSSYCYPGACTQTITLRAGARARKQLGLNKALLGRKTGTQRLVEKRGFISVEGSHVEFDLPRKVVQKMDGLDKLELRVTFEVSAPDSERMKQVRFTESGTLKMDRRRSTRFNPYPRGQGLHIIRGTCPEGLSLCGEEVNGD